MEVVTREEQRLPYDALIRETQKADGARVPRAEDVRERAVHGAEVGDELALLPRRGRDRQVQRPRRADRFLHQVRERPAAADVRRVGRVVLGDARAVVYEVLDVDVGVCRAGREREQDGEECVLQEDGLPQLPPHLLVEDACVGADDVGVPVQSHGVRLSDEDPGEGPAV